MRLQTKHILAAFAVVAVLLASQRIPPTGPGYPGLFIRVYITLLAVTLLRFFLSQITWKKLTKVAVYTAACVCLIPHVHSCLGLWHYSSPSDPLKLLGDPLWVLLLPTVSFLAVDLKVVSSTRRAFVARSALELAIAFPLWTLIYIALLVVTGAVTDV